MIMGAPSSFPPGPKQRTGRSSEAQCTCRTDSHCAPKATHSPEQMQSGLRQSLRHRTSSTGYALILIAAVCLQLLSVSRPADAQSFALMSQTGAWSGCRYRGEG